MKPYQVLAKKKKLLKPIKKHFPYVYKYKQKHRILPNQQKTIQWTYKLRGNQVYIFIEMMGCIELRVLGDFVNLLKSDHVIQSLILKTLFRLNVI